MTERKESETYSLNDGGVITDTESYEKYVPFKNYIAMLKTVNPDIKF